jgi:hypothetical protein
MNSASERRFAYIGIGLIAVAMCIVAFVAKGTGDDGDSIAHYLYSRDAFLYPKYFFNHWAKPLFVFISAPFAQFGWVGVKLMNVAALTVSLVLTYQLALRWQLRHAWLAPFFVVAQHRVLSHTLSGLTEPMFAAVLVWCVWLEILFGNCYCVFSTFYSLRRLDCYLCFVGVFDYSTAVEIHSVIGFGAYCLCVCGIFQAQIFTVGFQYHELCHA